MAFLVVKASAGLIVEFRLCYVPILLGSGKAACGEPRQRVPLKTVAAIEYGSGTGLMRCVPVSR